MTLMGKLSEEIQNLLSWLIDLAVTIAHGT